MPACLIALVSRSSACHGVSESRTLTAETVIDLPSEPGPAHWAGTNWYRAFLVSRAIPPISDGAVIVVSKERQVWYIDPLRGHVIRRLQYDENETVVTSQNGAYVAVFSEFEHPTGDSIIKRLRIEDSRGITLWETGFTRLNPCEPTPNGGFVAYPSAHPLDRWTGDWFEIPKNTIPPPQPHGLLVYDFNGQLILEGIEYYQCREGTCWGQMSSDGRFLAVLFVSVRPENWESRRNQGDRACLVLYDLEERGEVWRHYFEGIRPAGLLMGPDAARIVCFVASEGEYLLSSTDYHVYLFDKQGQQLLDEALPGCEDIAPPGGIAMSEDGSVFAYSTRAPGLFVRRASDGGDLWSLRGEEASHITNFALDTNGAVLMLTGYVSARQGRIQPVLSYILPDSTVDLRCISEALLGSRFPVKLGTVGDGKHFWMVYNDQLSVLTMSAR